MTNLTSSPRLSKGAIVSVSSIGVPRPIPFQYNPETISRSISPRWGGAGGAAEEVMRLKGAAEETISMDVYLDATDRLEKNDVVAKTVGILPQLAALEMLINPSTLSVALNTALEKMGTIEVLPPSGSLVLLIWGLKRIVPIRLESLSISEEAHDPQLNPIRARVSLSLRVLTYSDLPSTHAGYWLSISHQVVQETMAATAAVDGAVRMVPQLPNMVS